MIHLHIDGINEPYELVDYADGKYIRLDHPYYGCEVECSLETADGQAKGEWVVNIPIINSEKPEPARAWAETINLAAELCEQLNLGKTWKIEASKF